MHAMFDEKIVFGAGDHVDDGIADAEQNSRRFVMCVCVKARFLFRGKLPFYAMNDRRISEHRPRACVR